MDYYEEKYKEALEKASKLKVQNPFDTVGQMVEHIFPELKEKESEDERIRKAIIAYISHGQHYGVSNTDMIAWLEKQDEQKPTDKTKPKFKVEFKVGDWIVGNDGTFKITQYEDEYGYELTDTTGCVVHFVSSDYVESNFHLWTIADAKDGDVLCYETKNDFKIFIYKQGHIHYHCCYSNGHLTPVDSFFTLQKHLLCYIHPATKEQRDMLFHKMKEEGYEWDAKNKELKQFGINTLDADKVIEWLKPYGVLIDDFVEQFKKDFGL